MRTASTRLAITLERHVLQIDLRLIDLLLFIAWFFVAFWRQQQLLRDLAEREPLRLSQAILEIVLQREEGLPYFVDALRSWSVAAENPLRSGSLTYSKSNQGQ